MSDGDPGDPGAPAVPSLVPVRFLARAGVVYRDEPAVIDGELELSYGELWSRARRLAGLLAERGVEPGDRVAVIAPNTPAMLDAHYGPALAGAPIVPLNVRLATAELVEILRHSGARLLLADGELADAHPGLPGALPDLEVLRSGDRTSDYEQELAAAPARGEPPLDELALLSLNYTSGTTGRPKGVMAHHRGAYLQALAMLQAAELDRDSVFLWTLPMFHCNGWCFTWTVTAAGGKHVCLRRPEPGEVWRLVRERGVTHLNAAPTVLVSLAAHHDAAPVERPLHICTGGAPPAPAVLERLDALGIRVTHLYGLTETFGPAVVCEWPRPLDDLPADRRAVLKARQGIANVVSQPVRVIDGDGRDLPQDGTSTGEVVLFGNNVMRGYYRDPEATREAFTADGWFRTGDIGVLHPDGALELKDRAKDIIISGGENIASVEIEQALMTHPDVLEAAVVGIPDDHWGERPGAYVELHDRARVTTDDLRAHLRERLAGFKVPEHFEYGELPRTATGKIQKFVLRERASR